ncbi:hypothetical protein WJX79_002331 [Trebouxia sp. C0005]
MTPCPLTGHRKRRRSCLQTFRAGSSQYYFLLTRLLLFCTYQTTAALQPKLTPASFVTSVARVRFCMRLQV